MGPIIGRPQLQERQGLWVVTAGAMASGLPAAFAVPARQDRGGRRHVVEERRIERNLS
jgi:hypothetical protein